ncbi:hypothetical protein LXA43DRAFT_707505 [Ganoderma leucocontextum]|nr:hypothetical protein LXA43DRAFT_707505 [Ganoderma leucocontextum]
MKTTFAALLSAAAVAATSYASLLPRAPTFCAGATTASTSSIDVGGNTVDLTMLSCGPPVNKRQDPTTTAVAAPTPTPDVCGELCENVCADSGPLPPVAEDCAVIVDAITILNGSTPSTFLVEANHAQVLTFGTCSFFFENLSLEPVEYCWLSFAQVASAAGAACFPPVQPIHSEGLCLSPNGLWQVGAAHA